MVHYKYAQTSEAYISDLSDRGGGVGGEVRRLLEFIAELER